MKTLNTLRGFALLAGLLAAAAGWTQQKPQNTALAKATVAAGCFWCVEEAFDPVPGVVSTTSGYMGGQRRNPTYKEVSSGTTGHTEVVQVVYDPAKVSYEKLLEVFWRNVDPTVQDRTGMLFGSWELGRDYGLADYDGRRPDWGRHKIDFSVLPPTWIDLFRTGADLEVKRLTTLAARTRKFRAKIPS